MAPDGDPHPKGEADAGGDGQREHPLGKETDAPLADWIDIGVMDADGQPLFFEKKKIEQEETEFRLVVAKKPAKAGIDPYNKLIDRRPKDNAIPVEIE